jgi:hypothetical protein
VALAELPWRLWQRLFVGAAVRGRLALSGSSQPASVA